MAIETKIEWCDSTVNPIMGCTGCALRDGHCYAAVLCNHYAGRKGWPRSFDNPEHFPGRLEKAVKWRDLTGEDRPDKPWLNGLPRHIFVNDLSDGFCPDADPWQWLAPVLPAMHSSPHVWLLLTKWPDRTCQFFEEWGKPIPGNFYFGTTVQNQAALWRIDELIRISAAVHFVNFEPLLDDVAAGFEQSDLSERIDGAIVGGESGPGARPMHPDWARALREWALYWGISFFFKQWGAWAHIPSDTKAFPHNAEKHWFGRNLMARVGKKRAGRLLDGREWNEMPGGGK